MSVSIGSSTPLARWAVSIFSSKKQDIPAWKPIFPKCQTIPSPKSFQNLNQPEECFACMAGNLSAVGITSSRAPCVLPLLQLAHCSGDHPLWRGTRMASHPYGRLDSRWQILLCQPCTVCKLEWCTAGCSPAGTSPPAQRKIREIIAQLEIANSTFSGWGL